MSDEFQPGRTEVIRGRIQSSEQIFFCEARGKAIVDALKGDLVSPVALFGAESNDPLVAEKENDHKDDGCRRAFHETHDDHESSNRIIYIYMKDVNTYSTG
jgi:hypothetical protein